LYGNITASNSQICDSAAIANATEFIESPELENAFENTATALCHEWEVAKEKIKKYLIEGDDLSDG